MAKQEGIVTRYDGTYGEITSNSVKYIFLEQDIDCDDINVGDFVNFRGEAVHDTNRAYFVKSLGKDDEVSVKEGYQKELSRW